MQPYTNGDINSCMSQPPFRTPEGQYESQIQETSLSIFFPARFDRYSRRRRNFNTEARQRKNGGGTLAMRL